MVYEHLKKNGRKYDNLAQFVFNEREKLGLSVSGLSKKCNLSEDVISNIEQGLETFLPTTITSASDSPMTMKAHSPTEVSSSLPATYRGPGRT